MARLHEIDRQAASLRLRRYGITWIVLPALVGIQALVAQRIFADDAWTIRIIATAGVTLLVSAATVIHGFGVMRRRADDLDAERKWLTNSMDRP